nr:unnamed protein product [Callosobruchus analis]
MPQVDTTNTESEQEPIDDSDKDPDYSPSCTDEEGYDKENPSVLGNAHSDSAENTGKAHQSKTVPSVDTCDQCDKFKIKIQESSDENEKLQLSQDHNHHLKDDENRYSAKRKDKECREKLRSLCLIYKNAFQLHTYPTPEPSTRSSYGP